MQPEFGQEHPMLRRQALCTLATTIVAAPLASPLVASPNRSATAIAHCESLDLLQLLNHSLPLLQAQTGSHQATVAFAETSALLLHTRRILLAGQQGSAACWQACSDAVARALTFLPQQSPAAAPLQNLQLRLAAACHNRLSSTPVS
jgi:hypothetical protein